MLNGRDVASTNDADATEVQVTEGGYPCSVAGEPCPCGFDSEDCR